MISNYLLEYGFLFLFIVVLLEYMNLPGFPSGIIMPIGGLWIYNSNLNLLEGLIVTVLAGLVGSWILYFIGRFGGVYLLDKYCLKFPSQKKIIDKNIAFLNEKGYLGIFISKLLPVARTITPIPAGVIKLNFMKYTLYSALGILVWNSVLMGSGYFFGDKVLNILI